jgi:hypothetical protein
MTNQWVPGPPPVPPQWTNPLPPSNDWNDTPGCSAPTGPSVVDGVVITGVPATVSSLYWQVCLNDGGSPPNFEINHLDGAGNVLDAALQISGADLSATFAGPVYLARDPVEPMEAVTLEYLEAHGAGVEEAPDNQTYGRTEGAWNLVVPAAGGTFTGQTNLAAGGAVTGGALLFAGNAVCSLPNVAQLQIGGGSLGQVPATDGSGNLSWVTPVTGGPYLPLSGGTITGSLTVNTVLTVQGSNSLVLNGPNGNQRAILGQTSTLTRWQMMLGDGTSEGLNNTGSNFSLTAYSTTGGFLGNWLTIARADGSTVFNGSGVTIQGGLAVNGLLALASPNNLAIYGGTAGQILSTNGSGVLSWINMGGYALPPASTTVLGGVKVDGTTVTAAGDGTITAHGIAEAPTDGKLYSRQNSSWAPIIVPMGDNRIINGDMRIDQRNNGASVAANGYVVDRWTAYASQTGKLQWARNSSTGLPAFPYALTSASISAYTSLAADLFYFYQPIEADMISDFGWGAAGAQPVTFSFWAFSTLTGTFGGAICNYAGTRSYPFTFSLPTASTWTKIVLTIPGDPAGTWVMQGNAGALTVNFDLGSGVNWRAAAGAWAAGNYVGATGAVSVVGTNGATLYVTGVKLEIGSVATPFTRQSLAKSMADCQRYFQIVYPLLRGNGAAGGYLSAAMTIPFMRASPTSTLLANGSASNLTAAQFIVLSNNSVQYQIQASAAGDFWASGASYMLSAEL